MSRQVKKFHILYQLLQYYIYKLKIYHRQEMLRTWHLLFIIKVLFFSFQMFRLSNSINQKIYLTVNQSSIIFPFLQVDQTIYTSYVVEGTSVTIHNPLQRVVKYNQTFLIGKNIHGQSLVKIIHTLHQIFYMFYVNPDSVLHYCLIKSNSTQQLTSVPLVLNVPQSEIIPRYLNFEGMEIIKQNQIILWTNRSMMIVRFIVQKGSNYNYSNQIFMVQMPIQLILNLINCKSLQTDKFLCHTYQNIVIIKRRQNKTSHEYKPEQLQIQNIFTPTQNHKCITNIQRLEDNLIALCDCRNGCYNYQITDNNLTTILYDEISILNNIIVMQVIDAAPKGATMVLASNDILLLMKWGYDTIAIADSMLLPGLVGGELWDIDVSADNICLKYRLVVMQTQRYRQDNQYKFQYIFIQYDSIRIRYDQLNIILNSPYIYPLYQILYNIEQTGQLSLRIFNPFYYLIDYEPTTRYITIKAYDTGVHEDKDWMENQTVVYEVVAAVEGQIYVNYQYTAQIDLNYQYQYPSELYEKFVGRVRLYEIIQKQISIQEPQPQLQQQKPYQQRQQLKPKPYQQKQKPNLQKQPQPKPQPQPKLQLQPQPKPYQQKPQPQQQKSQPQPYQQIPKPKPQQQKIQLKPQPQPKPTPIQQQPKPKPKINQQKQQPQPIQQKQPKPQPQPQPKPKPKQSQQNQQPQKITTIYTRQDKRILSIYNGLQCIGLINSGSYTFNRLMTKPQINRVYVQECTSQKKENIGDFICQVKQIVDKISDKLNLKAMADIDHRLYFIPFPQLEQDIGSNPKIHKYQYQWQLDHIGLGYQNIQYPKTSKPNHNTKAKYQIWIRKLVQPNNNIYPPNPSKLYQYIILTNKKCLYTVTNRHTVTPILDHYIIYGTVHHQSKKIIVSVLDTGLSEVVICMETDDPELQEEGHGGIVNVFVQLGYQNVQYYRYRVFVSYLCNNITKYIIYTLHIHKTTPTLTITSIQPQPPTAGQLHTKSQHIRKYSHYLYSFNNTHVTKYLLFPINNKLPVLYTHALELRLGNELILVRNVGQYMLLVYEYSYRILDLDMELFGLVVDDQLVHGVELGNTGVYDMIIVGSDTLLLGVNNVMRSYDRKLHTSIGPYPIKQGQIRSYHSVQISAIPYNSSQRTVRQAFNVTVHYQTEQIQIRGITIKMLRDLPYCASNQTLIIFQNMFIGPIEEYYIIDVYDGGIVMLNHIEKIYQLSSKPSMEYLQQQPNIDADVDTNNIHINNAINRWIKSQTIKHIKQYKYYMLLYRHIDNPINIIDKNKHRFVYCNRTHIVIVQLGNGIIQYTVGIEDGFYYMDVDVDIGGDGGSRYQNRYQEYYMIQYNYYTLYVVYSNTNILYLNISNTTIQKNLLNIKQHYGYEIKQLTITTTTVQQINTQKWIAFLLLKPISRSQGIPNNIGYVDLLEDVTRVRVICSQGQYYCNIQYMAAIDGLVIYAKLAQLSLSKRSDGQDLQFGQNMVLCVQNVQGLVSDKRVYSCKNMLQIIPPIYYITDIDSYYKLVPINTQTQQQKTKIKFLLLSKYDNAYHLQLLLIVSIKRNIGNSSGSGRIYTWTYTCRWIIKNCFVSLSKYQAGYFISFYINSTGFDYFILQYNVLTRNRVNVTNTDDKDYENILAFYRYNDDYSRCCGYVGGLVSVNQYQISNILHIQDPQYYPVPNQSLMFTTTQVFHLQKNITFILNYQNPPALQYAVIYARNRYFNNKFYSKLKYQSDPGQKYFWLYCWIGFFVVFVFLGVLKIISVMIDRGIIKWSKSLSSQDDSAGSPGDTVHFSSGAMLTEDSYKSLPSP